MHLLSYIPDSLQYFSGYSSITHDQNLEHFKFKGEKIKKRLTYQCNKKKKGVETQSESSLVFKNLSEDF